MIGGYLGNRTRKHHLATVYQKKRRKSSTFQKALLVLEKTCALVVSYFDAIVPASPSKPDSKIFSLHCVQGNPSQNFLPYFTFLSIGICTSDPWFGAIFGRYFRQILSSIVGFALVIRGFALFFGRYFRQIPPVNRCFDAR